MIRVKKITELPDQIVVLHDEAIAEGFNIVETLRAQWDDGSMRFERPGEMLAAAFVDEELAGIGGVTEDVLDTAWLRMRRFYVLPRFRRSGVGGAIARFLIDGTPSSPIALHTDTENGAMFWQALGFVPSQRFKTSYILRR